MQTTHTVLMKSITYMYSMGGPNVERRDIEIEIEEGRWKKKRRKWRRRGREIEKERVGEREAEVIFEEITSENFHKLRKDIKQRIQISINLKHTNTHTHINKSKENHI